MKSNSNNKSIPTQSPTWLNVCIFLFFILFCSIPSSTSYVFFLLVYRLSTAYVWNPSRCNPPLLLCIFDFIVVICCCVVFFELLHNSLLILVTYSPSITVTAVLLFVGNCVRVKVCDCCCLFFFLYSITSITPSTLLVCLYDWLFTLEYLKRRDINTLHRSECMRVNLCMFGSKIQAKNKKQNKNKANRTELNWTEPN